MDGKRIGVSPVSYTHLLAIAGIVDHFVNIHIRIGIGFFFFISGFYRQISLYAGYLPKLQENLPVEAAYKKEKMATNFWELLQQHQGDLTKSGRRW